MAAVITAVNTWLGTFATDITAAIATNAPVLLAVFGAMLGIGILLKLARRVVGR